MVGAALVKAVYCLPTWTRTARLISEHAGHVGIPVPHPAEGGAFTCPDTENRPHLAVYRAKWGRSSVIRGVSAGR